MANKNKLCLPIIFLLVCYFMDGVYTANILVYGAFGTHSTRISMLPLMESLVDKGHTLTYLSAYENFEDPEKKSAIRYYTPEKLKQAMEAKDSSTFFFEVRKQNMNPEIWLNIQDIGVETCETLYSDPDFVEWVKTSSFDLVITESVVNECSYGLVHVFGTKLVVYGTTTMLPWFPDAFGFPDETSTVPHIIWDFAPGDGMDFIQRVKNALTPIVFNIKREYTYFPRLEEITRNGLGLKEGELPSFSEIERNVSLVLLTTHFTIDLPRSLPPHVIPIGGAVVGGKQEKPLSKRMEEYLNSATEGFVYISFGTVAEFTHFDKAVQLEFIEALKFFPEVKFLWKASIEINETLPENVKLTKWAPQQTVLAHQNIKAFITHCGMGSTTEAIYFGVPLILLPVLADQDVNANAIEAKGAGIKLEITTLKKMELEEALYQILHNDKYRNAMKELSDSFKDRPTQPVETGAWWIEYILRHKNSNDYLVPLSTRQPWWKRRQLDVWLSLGAGIFIILHISLAPFIVLFRMFKSGIKWIFGRNKSKTD